jgi:hypothetical protein
MQGVYKRFAVLVWGLVRGWHAARQGVIRVCFGPKQAQ